MIGARQAVRLRSLLSPCPTRSIIPGTNMDRRLVSAWLGGMIMLIDIIIWLVVGGVAGWLAGLLVRGYGFGVLGNIVVGIVGAFIAGWLLPLVGFVIVGGIVAAIINALIGAVILLLVIGLVRKA